MGYMALMRDRRCACMVSVGNAEEKSLRGKISVDKWRLLKCILKKQGGRAWTGMIWFRVGTSCGLL
jgi:hypothetical protein